MPVDDERVRSDNCGMLTISHAKRFLATCLFSVLVLSGMRTTRADDTVRPLGPIALACCNDGNSLYVACFDAHVLKTIDLPRFAVTATIELPASPTGVIPNNRNDRIFVTCAAPKSVIVEFDRQSGKPIRQIAAGHTAVALVMHPTEGQLFFANRL